MDGAAWRNHKAALEASYIGTGFAGCQRQAPSVESGFKGNGSIQRCLEDAAAYILPTVLQQWYAEREQQQQQDQDPQQQQHRRIEQSPTYPTDVHVAAHGR